MFDTIQSACSGNLHGPELAPNDHEAPLARFVCEHADALRNAGHLLGATAGLRLADAVVSDVATCGARTRAARRRRMRLLNLLRLENVHVKGSIEAARFARIDPADPMVEEICLLADGLADLLRTAHSNEAGEDSLVGETDRDDPEEGAPPRSIAA